MSADSDVATETVASESPLPDARDKGESRAVELEFEKVLGAVQRALQMASYLSVEEPGVTRVAVVSGEGQLIASAVLHSRSQASFVLDQLQPLGFVQRHSPSALQKLGCDVLIAHAADAEDGAGQTIVRASLPERWPPEGA